MYTVKWILPGESPDDAFAVRKTVFVEEQGFSLEIELDEIDAVAHHVVFYDREDKPVGCGRIFPDKAEPGTWIIGRVAALAHLRGTGLGRLLIEEMERRAKALGAVKTVLGAQCRAAGFYRRMGYSPFGEHYYEEACEHVHMHKVLR